MRSVPASQVLWILWYGKCTAADDLCTGGGIDLVRGQEEPCDVYTPLMVAMLNFRPDNQVDMQLTVDALIAANADLNAVAQGGRTALMMALHNFYSAEDQTPASVCISLIEAGEKQLVILVNKNEPCDWWQAQTSQLRTLILQHHCMQRHGVAIPL